MKRQTTFLVNALTIGVLLYSPYALAQISGNSGTGSHGSSMGSGSPTTTGIASDQAHISPPGTNSLGTANSSGLTGSGTVGANMEPSDGGRIDAEIERENSRIDSKINSVCRGC